MKENKITCFACGAELTKETEYSFDGKHMCQHCYDERTAVCNNCGERIWREEAEGDSNYTLCVRCYENSYTSCEDCGRLIHHDNAITVSDYNVILPYTSVGPERSKMFMHSDSGTIQMIVVYN